TRAVGRPIVDQPHLERRVAVGEPAPHRRPERVDLVPRRDDERDTRPALEERGAVAEEHRDRAHDKGSAPGRGECVGEADDCSGQPADLGGRHPVEAPPRRLQPWPDRVFTSVRCIPVGNRPEPPLHLKDCTCFPAGHGTGPTAGGFEGPGWADRGMRHPRRDEMAPRRSSSTALAALVIGTIAAVTEMVPVFPIQAALGVSPRLVLQSIASGVLGRAAYSGGAATVLLGIAFHLLISISFALAYVLVSDRWTALRRRPVLAGVAYGTV